MNDDLNALVRTLGRRRSVRHFRPDPVPVGLIEALLEHARRTPSGYNLQPWTVIVVRDPERRAELQRACLGQAQLTEAPVALVFAADTQPLRRRQAVIAQGLDEGHWNEAYASKMQTLTTLRFQGGPLRLAQPLKAVAGWLLSSFRPSPMFPVGRTGFEVWSVKQTALFAQSFLLLAAAAGLDTCPMEGLDERWVRKVVSLPRRFAVPLVVPVGFAADPPPDRPTPRLPLDQIVAHERYRGSPATESSGST